MYYSMIFIKNEWGKYNVRAARKRPYKSLEAAKKAVEKYGSGYVREFGKSVPVWSMP